MRPNLSTPSEKISEYLRLTTLLQGADYVLSHHLESVWPEYAPEQTRLQAPEGIGKLQLMSEQEHFFDANGNLRKVVLGHKPGDGRTYYVWMSRVGSQDLSPEYEIIHRREDGKLEIAYDGTPILNDRFMYNHQTKAVESYGKALEAHAADDAQRTSREVIAFATGTGKSYIVANVLKAIGAHGAVIVPRDMGEQIAHELEEVMPSGVEIREGLKIKAADATQVSRKLEGFKGIVVIEEQDLDRFMGTDARPGWLCNGERKHVSIDEAHEFTMRFDPDTPAPGMRILARLAKHNDIMAVTATPNDDLYSALGIEGRDPACSMTMFDATYGQKKRSFRPLGLENKQVGEPQDIRALTDDEREKVNAENEPQMRFATLVGYFGRDEYNGPDYFFDRDNQTWPQREDSDERYAKALEISKPLTNLRALICKPEARTGGGMADRGVAVLHTMKQNRVRYDEHKHIAFGVRPEMMRKLAVDLQSIHDETYVDMPRLRDAVWKKRAQSAIAEYVREYRREYGDVPRDLTKFLQEKGLSILEIKGKNLAKSSANQAAYRAAIRNIEPEEFKHILPDGLFSELIGSPEDIDLSAEAQSAAKNTAYNAALRNFAVREAHISPNQAREMALAGKLEKYLHEKNVDMQSFAPAEPDNYALAIVKENGQDVVYDGKGERLSLTTKDVEKLVKQGRVMHVADTHHFVTGFSDKDLMMATRIVENMGDYTVRATQILGRPIRAMNGVAALNELVGPLINMNGTLGVDKYFSCHDVMSEDFFDRSKLYERNYVQEGRALWQQPPTTQQGVMREPERRAHER